MPKRIGLFSWLLPLLLAVPGGLSAQEEPVDVSGVWQVVMTRETVPPVHGTISLEQDGEKLSGTWQLEGDTGTRPVEGSVRRSRLKLAWTLVGGSGELQILFRGKVEDEVMTGTVLFGELDSADWWAERKR